MVLRTVLLGTALAFASPALAAAPAPLSVLAAKANIPFEQFTLPNGLRVIVHTDRKAPVVAVNVWYHIGSKDEPPGKTGFAHLFEHLMFGGSENVANFDESVIALGAANNNGSTWYDRTNYHQTVPAGALDRMLFIESDRMGHLLGAVTQEKLDQQRGVVQNEKRQGDNQPFGLVDYYVSDALYPVGHPYRHDTIGSMADLNAASLETVRNWFRAHYGPENAVLVLAGDIDAATARPMVAKWFGDIPRKPAFARAAAPVPTLAAPRSLTITDRVPYTRLSRYWSVPGVNGADSTALDVAASVLGGLSSSRLDNALVRGDQTAVNVSAGTQTFEQVGLLEVRVDVKPGSDAVAVGKRLDALIADFLKTGPTADEVRRVATRGISGAIGGFEQVNGKAAVLAEGLLYSGDPAKYKRELAELASITPARALAAARKWMLRPALSVTVVPGPRDTSPATLAITGDAVGPVPAPVAPPPLPPRAERSIPPIAPLASLTFPKIERATLTNGIKVYFARRPEIPVVRVAVSFDAGSAADPQAKPGLQALTMSLLDEGTTTLNSTQIAETQERLGAAISSSGGVDRSVVGLYALSANLAPSLDLLADVVRNPAFAPAEVERLRGQQLAGIAAQLSQPQGIVNTILPARLYGEASPYGRSASGTAASVKALTRDDVVRFRGDWLVPDKASIFVTGDTTLAELKPLLDARFGNWPSNRMARPVKDLSAAIPAPQSTRIYFADRPGSPQSVIAVAQVLSQTGKDPALLPLRQANDVLGGSFLSRLNSDLREAKGWSYGVRSAIPAYEGRVPYIISAPVQTDRTGDSVKAVLADVRDYLTRKGTTPAERDRTIDGNIRELPGQFETSGAVLSAMQSIVQFGRPDDYYETLPARYRALTPGDFDRVARSAIDPDKLVIVVVGDAARVKPQLATLGLPVEEVQLPSAN